MGTIGASIILIGFLLRALYVRVPLRVLFGIYVGALIIRIGFGRPLYYTLAGFQHSSQVGFKGLRSRNSDKPNEGSWFEVL